MISRSQSKYQSCSGILDSLQLQNETFRQAGKNAVAIVQSADDESMDKLFQRLSIDIFTHFTEMPQLEETAAGELADMLLKCQFQSINPHAQVAHNGRRLDKIGSYRWVYINIS